MKRVRKDETFVGSAPCPPICQWIETPAPTLRLTNVCCKLETKQSSNLLIMMELNEMTEKKYYNEKEIKERQLLDCVDLVVAVHDLVGVRHLLQCRICFKNGELLSRWHEVIDGGEKLVKSAHSAISKLTVVDNFIELLAEGL